MNYVIIGSALAGNQGAASMLTASIQLLTKSDPNAQFTLLSVYPEEDEAQNTYKNLTVLPAKPVFLALIINTLSIVYKLLPPLRSLLRKQRHIQALAGADVFLDQGGITFVDGRAVFLLYNVASILPGILVTKNVIKCSQALGPFKTTTNRTLAKTILPHVNYILTRGRITHNYTKKLGLTNTKIVPDLAFAMEITTKKERQAKDLIKKLKLTNAKEFVIVAPSQVMRKKCDKVGTDYIGSMVGLMKEMLDTGYTVLLLPHSMRNSSSTHNNDLPLCREIYTSLPKSKNLHFIRQQLGPEELRYIIGRAKMLVTSRFHAMVSSLSMGVPVMVIGWNHKYQEVLDMFKLKKNVITAKDLTESLVLEHYHDFSKQVAQEQKQIHKHLPAVKKQSAQHGVIIQKSVLTS